MEHHNCHAMPAGRPSAYSLTAAGACHFAHRLHGTSDKTQPERANAGFDLHGLPPHHT